MNNAQIESLINGLQFSDPRVAEALRLLNKEAARATAEMDARLRIIEGPPVVGPTATIPEDVQNFQVETRSFSVHFSFERTSIAQRAFEIRVGNVWETAQLVLTTSSLQFDIDPVVVGTYTYLIKAISVTGDFSLNATAANLIVTNPSGVDVSSSVIDNNVLLSWTPSFSQFQIDYYEILRDESVIGQQGSTFFVIFEPIAGTYTYSVIPIDIAGNRGAPSTRAVVVSMPPDYEVKDVRVSDLTGTRTNVARFVPTDSYVRLICNTNITETWQEHFVNNSWTTPQQQVDAGYPIYAQPAPVNGTYDEVYDYGIILTNVLITITWNKMTVVPDVSFTPQISFSTDGSSFSTPQIGTVIYAVSVRYLRIQFTFVAS